VPVIGLEGERAGDHAGCPLLLIGSCDDVRAECARCLALIGVLGDSEDGPGQAQGSQRGDGAQAEGSSSEHNDAFSTRNAGGKRRMYRACGRFDHYGGLVGQVVRDRMQLALVSDEAGRPSTTGVPAVAGL